MSPWRFSDEEYKLLRAAGRTRVWPAEAVLFLKGDPPDSLVLIEAGLVKVTAEADNGYTAVLALRGPGELVGELACLDGRERSGTVTATQRVTGTVITAERFQALLRANGPLALAVLRSVAARLRDSDDLRSGHGAHAAGVRVARVLHDLAVRYGSAAAEPPGALVVAVGQQDLAGAAGTSRESVVRTLRKLQRQGLVSTARGRTVVLDLPALGDWTDD